MEQGQSALAVNLFAKYSIEMDREYKKDMSKIVEIFSDYLEKGGYNREVPNPYYFPLHELTNSLTNIFYKARLIDTESVKLLGRLRKWKTPKISLVVFTI